MANRLGERVNDLRNRAGMFNEVLRRLHEMGPALRSDKHARAEWQQLMLDGRAMKAAIQTSGKMIDGANKWVARTFQRKALDSIPFAADVVETATNGSISAIDHYIERAQNAIRKFAPIYESFLKLDKKEQDRLAATPDDPDLPKKQGTATSLILIAILGGLVWWGCRTQRGNTDEDLMSMFDHD